jgi:2-polyprenyl-3-methyl-5-hydroxy-6-metoxy-1,4-benzoquinol methylase
MREVDFGKQSGDYARHRPGFPDSFYNRIQTFLPLSATEALDVGTGPGIVALELAKRGARVTGIDMRKTRSKLHVTEPGRAGYMSSVVSM